MHASIAPDWRARSDSVPNAYQPSGESRVFEAPRKGSVLLAISVIALAGVQALSRLPDGIARPTVSSRARHSGRSAFSEAPSAQLFCGFPAVLRDPAHLELAPMLLVDLEALDGATARGLLRRAFTDATD